MEIAEPAVSLIDREPERLSQHLARFFSRHRHSQWRYVSRHVDLRVESGLTIHFSAAATTPGNVVRKIETHDGWSDVLGYIFRCTTRLPD
jgi:hypothetical protein